MDGDALLLVGATASLPDGQVCEVVPERLRLTVVPAIGSPKRSSVREDDPMLRRLVAVFRDAGMLSEIRSLPELALLTLGRA